MEANERPDPSFQQVELEEREGAVVVHLNLEVLATEEDLNVLDGAVRPLIDRDIYVVIDMSKVKTVGSMILGHLIGLRKRFVGSGFEMALAEMTENVFEAYSVASLDRLVPAFSSIDEAVSELTA